MQGPENSDQLTGCKEQEIFVAFLGVSVLY
jgi:hypothetical protein